MYVMGAMRYRLIGAGISLIVFLIVYFTVIRPDNNAAQNAIRASRQQAQQLEQQLSHASGVSQSQADQIMSKAQKLAACMQKAGADPNAIAACTSKFG